MRLILNNSQAIGFDRFPYDFRHWNYDNRLLDNILYAPFDPDLCDDDHVCVMDYDGIEEWIHKDIGEDENPFADCTGREYVPYHLGRTIDPIAYIYVPVLFINCSSVPYIEKIMNRSKIYETRSKDMLRSLVGQTVFIAETGHGKPIVRCTADIITSFKVTNQHEWECFRDYTQVPEGSDHDWKQDTKCKWLYEFANVLPVEPFTPAKGIRHGRTWMEYNGRRR